VPLAAHPLEQLGQPWVLEVSHMGYLFGLLDALDVPEASRAALLAKLKAKNLHELKAGGGGEKGRREVGPGGYRSRESRDRSRPRRVETGPQVYEFR